VYIEDSFGQVVQKRFTFSDNTEKSEEKKEIVIHVQ
jgi:hypothetical protein